MKKILKFTIIIFYLIQSSCNNEALNIDSCYLQYDLLKNINIDSIEIPDPVVVGSKIVLKGNLIFVSQQCINSKYSLIGSINGKEEIENQLTLYSSLDNQVFFIIDNQMYETLGPNGLFIGKIKFLYNSLNNSKSFEYQKDISFYLVDILNPSINYIDIGDAYFNDPINVRGENLLVDEEGGSFIKINGDFNNQEESFNIEELKIEMFSYISRQQSVFLLSPEISKLQTGTFSGYAQLCNVNLLQQTSCSNQLPVQWNIKESKIEGFDPQMFSLGQIVSINGRGFIGGQFGTTTIETSGYFEILDGTKIMIEQGMGIVPNFINGSELLYTVVMKPADKSLVSYDFNINRGFFVGDIYMDLCYDLNHDDYIDENSETKKIGPIKELSFSFGPTKQVFWVKFTDNFSFSLELFGLKEVEYEIISRVIDKMRQIYDGINIEFRTQEPDDFYEGGYGIIEIGGTDPNGLGLMGYENTYGKDSYNLRLHDRIGGYNAQTQEDGYPGYGGVFIESFLLLSSHPELNYDIAEQIEPEPEFDIIFDPVRYNYVKAGEYPDGADEQRIEDIEKAINALSNLIGDTAAHEIGHSLGLANPGLNPEDMPDADVYHRLIPQAGCLMNRGENRSFEERAGINNNTGGHFCGDEIEYLQNILPVN